jgi:hypothetical protein
VFFDVFLHFKENSNFQPTASSNILHINYK